ncbi:MAG: Hsp20/alpha crystallin family protein [Calothrix sp. SM1_7_51]|nr:Hsp20/alpha crystallin family protein [Calothrix sp. SM1_7_51]
MNRLFDEFMPGEHISSIFSKLENTAWTPVIELFEDETEIILKVQIPGIDAKDIDIQASENAVSIAGEYQEEKQGESKGFYRSEFSYGHFQRIVPLPAAIKHEQVKAEVKDGVVTLTLRKAETSRRNFVKVDLTLQEKARSAMAQERQHNEHLQQTMHERAVEDLDAHPKTKIAEEARSVMVEQRLRDKHLEETMHGRTAAEIGTNATTMS